MLADLLGDRLGHRDHARLGAGVDGLAPLADAAGVGADRDDPARPALDHVVEHRARRVDEAPHVDGDLALPLLARLVDEQAVDGPAGAVDEHVDAAERRDRVRRCVAVTSSAFVTSVRRWVMRPSGPSAITASACASSTSAISTRAPSAAKPSVSARPMFDAPPVMTTPLPSRFEVHVSSRPPARSARAAPAGARAARRRGAGRSGRRRRCPSAPARARRTPRPCRRSQACARARR